MSKPPACIFCLSVQLVDVFENAHYFQLVMEKHGDGMDLFEFIDHSPTMDRALGKLHIQTGVVTQVTVRVCVHVCVYVCVFVCVYACAWVRKYVSQ